MARHAQHVQGRGWLVPAGTPTLLGLGQQLLLLECLGLTLLGLGLGLLLLGRLGLTLLGWGGCCCCWGSGADAAGAGAAAACCCWGRRDWINRSVHSRPPHL